MTVNEALALHAAVQACSTNYTVMHDGKPVSVMPSFSGPARLTLARMQHQLKAEVDAFTTATQQVVKELGGPWEADQQASPECVTARQRIAELGAQESTVTLDSFTLPQADFLSDACHLPPSVIQVLLPFIQ